MPYAVKASDNRCFRGHEGIGHPYGEDGILLSKRLSCSDFTGCLHRCPIKSGMTIRRHCRLRPAISRSIATSDETSHGELEHTAHKRYESHKQKHHDAHLTMDDESGCKGYSQCKRKSPYIECQVREPHQPPVNFRKEVSDEPCRHARDDEQREDLSHNHTECRPEIDFRHRMHQWHYQRHKNSSQKIRKS